MRFSVLRLMMAVVPAAGAFAFLRLLGHGPGASVIFGVMIGGSLAWVVLIATKRDLVDVAKGLASVAFVMAMAPIVLFVARYFGCFVAGIFGVFVCAVFFATFRQLNSAPFENDCDDPA